MGLRGSVADGLIDEWEDKEQRGGMKNGREVRRWSSNDQGHRASAVSIGKDQEAGASHSRAATNASSVPTTHVL
jgi:hypothetical protein